jgi:hypothetical protein
MSGLGYDPAEVLEYNDRRDLHRGDRLLGLCRSGAATSIHGRAGERRGIAKILEMGRYTQTGNTQLLRYIVLTTETLREITPIALKPCGMDVKRVDKKAWRPYNTWISSPSGSLVFRVPEETAGPALPRAPTPCSWSAAGVCTRWTAASSRYLELMINALGLGACSWVSGLCLRSVGGAQTKGGDPEGEAVIFMMVFGPSQRAYRRTVQQKEVGTKKI